MTDFFSHLPKDVKFMIVRLIYESVYEELLFEYKYKWGLNMGYDPDVHYYDINDFGYSLSYTTGPVIHIHYFRNIESFDGAFRSNLWIKCTCIEKIMHCDICDPYTYIRNRLINPGEYWSYSYRRFVSKLSGATAYYDEHNELIKLPERYIYSNGGLKCELKYRPFIYKNNDGKTVDR